MIDIETTYYVDNLKLVEEVELSTTHEEDIGLQMTVTHTPHGPSQTCSNSLGWV